MTKKTEQQIERERNAVSAMMNAKANMTVTLDRITTLESQLRNAKYFITDMKNYTGAKVVRRAAGDRPEYTLVHADIDEMLNNINLVLG